MNIHCHFIVKYITYIHKTYTFKTHKQIDLGAEKYKTLLYEVILFNCTCMSLLRVNTFETYYGSFVIIYTSFVLITRAHKVLFVQAQIVIQKCVISTVLLFDWLLRCTSTFLFDIIEQKHEKEIL